MGDASQRKPTPSVPARRATDATLKSALIEAISRWVADVEELLPDRMDDLRAIVDYGLNHRGNCFNRTADRRALRGGVVKPCRPPTPPS